MSMVKFATLCDHCAKRSDEYTMWPACRDCGLDTCTQCAADGSITEPDEGRASTCICETCDEDAKGQPR